ncbi:Hypothetical protein SRAE_1000270200 [Strongyloides ratti]|uniref:Uncharacterized protein n=1 Tax=Strongyloides ratti TaxID=34506 RepID=A0A090L8I9_STRRB|nr:Hypothetical protein SRAE_1000270200 [Strongyloides ratti]CEF64448.1 Hypothetical protein SRAE_1000270200 [Strongyloides ratti]
MNYKSVDVETFDGLVSRSGFKNPMDPLDTSLGAFISKSKNTQMKLSSSERKKIQKEQKKEKSLANKK